MTLSSSDLRELHTVVGDPAVKLSITVRKKIRAIITVAAKAMEIHEKSQKRIEAMLHRLFPNIGDIDRETLAAIERAAHAALDLITAADKALVRAKSRTDLVAWIDIAVVQMHASAAAWRKTA